MEYNKNLVLLALALLLAVCARPGYLQAADIGKAEPNNTLATAQDIDGAFSTGDNPDIQDATLWPWVSISADGDGTFDYYAFEVPAAGVRGIFDIDYGITTTQSLDTEICLYAADGTFLATSDDSNPADGAAGSTSPLDSYFSYDFAAAGTYVIGVGEFNSFCNTGGMSGNMPDAGDHYELQISLSAHAAPIVDSDGDGVADGADCMPESDMNPTVVFEDCDSGVANTLFADGCTVSDLVHMCADDARNHGSFSSCVTAVTSDLRKAGEITGSGKGMIQSCAARSDSNK